MVEDQLIILSFVTALYNYMGCGEFEFVPVKHYPQIKSELIPPQPDSPNAYIYLNDYPKSWKRRMIGNDPYPAVGQYIPLKVGDIFKGRVDEHRRLLSYFEHDKRAQAARESFQRAKKLYGAAGPTFPRVTAVALEVARARIFDPLNYSFPRWFTHKAADPIRAVNGRLPLIRAGVTPYEDLLTLIQDIKKHDPDAQIRLPTTRYERKSDWFGLPRHIEQKAGTKSFKLPDTRVPLSPIEPSDLDPIEPQAESTLSRAARKRREDVRVLNHDWKLQRELDTDAGKAAQTRFDDIFDPRGRNYRRDWQRTNDGEVWESPSPPGTAPDKEPSPHEVPFSPAASEGPSQSIALDEEPWNRQSLEGYPGGPLNTDWEGDSGEPSNTFDWENSIVPDEAPMNADEKLWNSDEEPTNPDGELRNSDEEPMYSDEETIYSDEDEVPGIKPSKRRYTLETDPRPPTRRYTLEINLTPSTRRQTLEVKPRLSKRRFTETDQRPVKRVRSWNHRV